MGQPVRMGAGWQHERGRRRRRRWPEGYDGHAIFYVDVAKVEAALAEAETRGRTRAMAPAQVEIGRFANPDGHVVGVAEPAA